MKNINAKKVLQFKVDERLLQETVNYLGTRPYMEIHRLIMALQQCQPLIENPPENTQIDKPIKKEGPGTS